MRDARASRSRRAPRSAMRREVRRASPRPLIDEHHGDAGWEELDRRRDRGRPAARRADLVPLQRPARRQGVVLDHGDHRSPTTPWSPTASWSSGSAARQHGDLALRAGRADGDLPRHRADRPLRGPRPATRPVPMLRRGPGRRRRGLRGGVRPAAGDAGAPSSSCSAPTRSRPTPSSSPPTTSRSRSSRRRSRRSAATSCRDDWDAIRLVAHELAHQWFGNAVTLGALAGHLAARGLRLLRRVAVVRGVGRRHRRRVGAPPPRAARRPRPGPGAGRPRPGADVRRPGLQARRADPARAAAHRRRRRVLRAAAGLGAPSTPAARSRPTTSATFAGAPDRAPTWTSSSTRGSTSRSCRTCQPPADRLPGDGPDVAARAAVDRRDRRARPAPALNSASRRVHSRRSTPSTGGPAASMSIPTGPVRLHATATSAAGVRRCSPTVRPRIPTWTTAARAPPPAPWAQPRDPTPRRAPRAEPPRQHGAVRPG